MLTRRRVLPFTAVVVILSVQLGVSVGQDDGNYVETYRSGVERSLQALASVAPSGGGFIGSVFNKLPQTLKNVVVPASSLVGQGFGGILNVFKSQFQAIFPGTRWCGDGNVASSRDDVGLFSRTDACCRDHDNCRQAIRAGESLGPLVNNGIFTRSSCTCDHQFYRCLKDVRSVISNKIGYTYFTILRPQCHAYEYPIVSCAQRGSKRLVARKCESYNVDTRQPKRLQWFDNPDF